MHGQKRVSSVESVTELCVIHAQPERVEWVNIVQPTCLSKLYFFISQACMHCVRQANYMHTIQPIR